MSLVNNTKPDEGYAWAMALFSCITLMISNGMILTGLSVYDEVFINEFGWKIGEIKRRDLITLVLTGLCAPFIGIIIDRVGVKKCLLVGWLLLAFGAWRYSQINSLNDMYLIHAIYAIVLVLCGLNAAVILVSNWFVRNRGTAIGIALVGTSFGGIVMPQYFTAMNGLYEWRYAFQIAALFPLVMFVLTLVLVRNSPDAPLSSAAARLTEHVEIGGIPYASAIRSKSFWALALIAMATFYCALGVGAHIFKYMSDQGFDVQTATNAISVYFAAALVGKFVFGYLSNVLPRTRVFWGNLLVMLVGAILLSRMSVSLVWAAAVLFGLGWGGAYTMIQLSVMNIFGNRDAGKILGTITVLDAIGGGLGMWLTGRLYDHFGAYDVPFTVFVVLIAIALLCLTQVRHLTGGDKS